ncbi:MAG: DUF2071 domain-containing protein [Acidimicrobiia bacterium]|nr:DUF2071 domain-containing protein [Acidimicrobiia bacterium]
MSIARDYTGICPLSVDPVAMRHRWDQLTFVHWRYDPEVVQALLPPGLTVETFDGSAWVGLVPFIMEVRSKRGRVIPWPFRFPETNVRTYVIGPDGQPAVWFFSLDATRLGIVPSARATYRVPYFWSKMSVERSGDTMTYTLRRRWPGPRGARSFVKVEIGDRYEDGELTPFDHYLTARWVLFGSWGRRLLEANAEHDPWPLHHATAEVSDELTMAAGLPHPSGGPVVHWSPGVDVLIGLPHQARIG